MDLRDSEYRPLFGGPVDRPLFGGSNGRERTIHMTLGIVTTLLVTITLILAFFYSVNPPCGRHIYFALCIVALCVSHIVLIHWYRQGDVDPKFRKLIYMNTVVHIFLLL
ncbi:transmembrane protein 243-like isoform X2 [Ornithodoros turicata]|uniref:transmembrane protein 243-like isoform X2 n=1 Tax=Ornithodoros turicata TaxID=34597 RepID=UPI003139DA6A